MDANKWDKYIGTAHYPASLTSQDEERRNEAIEYTTKATVGLDPNLPLLVLGCGDGYEIKLLQDRGFKSIKGITWHPDEKRFADEQGVGAFVTQGDIHDMPFADGEFYNVISKETLEHMISPTIALSEINRVMKTGGNFVHYVPSGIEKQRDWYHYNCFPDWLWVDFFYKAGFDTERIIPDIEQIRYSGKKIKQAHWMTGIYDLNVYLNGIRRS